MNLRSVVFLLALLLAALNASAQEAQVPATEPTEEAVVETAGPIVVGNKICPVSGDKVGEMGEIIQQEYNGKIYNFCCSMCLKDFQKDPDKYVAMVEEMMAKEAAEEGQPEAAEGEMPEHEGMMHDHQHE